MKREILVIEIDVTNARETWTVAVQMAQLETRSHIDKQVIVRRSSREELICVPEVSSNNFVTDVRKEIRNA